MTTETYSAADAASELGVSQSRVRQLATERSVGERTIDGWRFTRADLDILGERRQTRGRPRTQPRDYLSLSTAEATLIAAMLNGHWREPGIAARDELLLSLLDSVGPDAEGERLDTVYGVDDWRSLVVRVAALSEPQAEGVMQAVEAFWRTADYPDHDDGLMAVGLL